MSSHRFIAPASLAVMLLTACAPRISPQQLANAPGIQYEERHDIVTPDRKHITRIYRYSVLGPLVRRDVLVDTGELTQAATAEIFDCTKKREVIIDRSHRIVSVPLAPRLRPSARPKQIETIIEHGKSLGTKTIAGVPADGYQISVDAVYRIQGHTVRHKGTLTNWYATTVKRPMYGYLCEPRVSLSEYEYDTGTTLHYYGPPLKQERLKLYSFGRNLATTQSTIQITAIKPLTAADSSLFDPL